MNNKNVKTIKNNSQSLRVKNNNNKILAKQTELNLYLNEGLKLQKAILKCFGSACRLFHTQCVEELHRW